jgi:phage regulator Rha-like protein
MKSIQKTKQTEIENRIYSIRGLKVMLDEDLAAIYGIETKRLNEQVKRNKERFPKDFMFQLIKTEFEDLKSQNATSSWGGRRTLPYAFTEHGTVMLASVLKSKKAVEANIQIVKAFVKLREIIASNKELAKRLYEMESKYDKKFAEIFQAIRELMNPDLKDYEKEVLRKGIKE